MGCLCAGQMVDRFRGGTEIEYRRHGSEAGMHEAEPEWISLPWDDVQEAADLAFSVWVGQPELSWAKQAWQALTEAKLTRYCNEAERYRVLFRLLVLGGIYSDFCD